jgi:hypothetical protein
MQKTEALPAAFWKFNFCPNGLIAPEFKALATDGSNSSGSQLELQEQLYHEPR